MFFSNQKKGPYLSKFLISIFLIHAILLTGGISHAASLQDIIQRVGSRYCDDLSVVYSDDYLEYKIRSYYGEGYANNYEQEFGILVSWTDTAYAFEDLLGSLEDEPNIHYLDNKKLGDYVFRRYYSDYDVGIVVLSPEYMIVVALEDTNYHRENNLNLVTTIGQDLLKEMAANGLLTYQAPSLNDLLHKGAEVPLSELPSDPGSSQAEVPSQLEDDPLLEEDFEPDSDFYPEEEAPLDGGDDVSRETWQDLWKDDLSKDHGPVEAPGGVGSVGNIPGPATTGEAVVGLVLPGLIATILGALSALGGGGMPSPSVYAPPGLDQFGFDTDGFDRFGFDADGFDRFGFDADGFDRFGFDADGFDRFGFDADGFDIDGFNQNGFDKDGFDRFGFDADGFDIDGFNQNGFDQNGYNRQGFDKDGFDQFGFDADGFDQNGFDQKGYDRQGFNQDSYNKNGYNKEGYDKNGFNREGYDKDGYGRDGFNKAGFNKEGYDKNGYDKNGYDADGYNKDGYNKDGFKEDGYNKDDFNKDGYDKDGYDLEGYDYMGYDRQGYDPWGYDRQGYGKDGFHWSGYDANGYNRNGKHWNADNLNPFEIEYIGENRPAPPLGQPYPGTVRKYGAKKWDDIPNSAPTDAGPETDTIPEIDAVAEVDPIPQDELIPQDEFVPPLGPDVVAEPESMVVQVTPQGAETLIIKDPETGGWINAETGNDFDLEAHEKNFPQQVKDYHDFVKHNEELEKTGQTAMQKALDKIDQEAKEREEAADWLIRIRKAAERQGLNQEGQVDNMYVRAQEELDKLYAGQEFDPERAIRISNYIGARTSGQILGPDTITMPKGYDSYSNLDIIKDALGESGRNLSKVSSADGSFSWRGMAGRIGLGLLSGGTSEASLIVLGGMYTMKDAIDSGSSSLGAAYEGGKQMIKDYTYGKAISAGLKGLQNGISKIKVSNIKAEKALTPSQIAKLPVDTQIKLGQVQKALGSGDPSKVANLYKNNGMRELSKLQQKGLITPSQAKQLNNVLKNQVEKSIEKGTQDAINTINKSTKNGVRIEELVLGDSGSSAKGGLVRLSTDFDRTLIPKFNSKDLANYAKTNGISEKAAYEKLCKEFAQVHQDSVNKSLGKIGLNTDNVGYQSYDRIGSSAGPGDSYTSGYTNARQAVSGSGKVFKVGADGNARTPYKVSGQTVVDRNNFNNSQYGSKLAQDPTKIHVDEAKNILSHQVHSVNTTNNPVSIAKSVGRAQKSANLKGMSIADRKLLQASDEIYKTPSEINNILKKYGFVDQANKADIKKFNEASRAAVNQLNSIINS